MYRGTSSFAEERITFCWRRYGVTLRV